MRFTIMVNTEGTQYSGCDEIKQVIDAESLEAAVNWACLWDGDDLSRVCGPDAAWIRTNYQVPPKYHLGLIKVKQLFGSQL